jgi:hypothetical protein
MLLLVDLAEVAGHLGILRKEDPGTSEMGISFYSALEGIDRARRHGARQCGASFFKKINFSVNLFLLSYGQ